MAIWQSNSSELAIFSFSDSFSDKNRQVFACSIDFRHFSTKIDSLDSLPKQPKKVAKPPRIWAKLGQMRNSGKKNQNLSIKSQKKFSTSQPYLGRIWGVSVGPLQSHFMDSKRLIPGADVHTCLACAKEMAFNQLWWYIWWKIPSPPKLPPEPSNVPYEECWDFVDHTIFDSLMESWCQIWAMGPMWNLWYSYLGCRFASVLGVTATVLKPCQRRCLRALGAQDPLTLEIATCLPCRRKVWPSGQRWKPNWRPGTIGTVTTLGWKMFQWAHHTL